MSPGLCPTIGRHFYVYFNYRRFKIPETKLENVFFTLITSGLMIFLMCVYNVAIHILDGYGR